MACLLWWFQSPFKGMLMRNISPKRIRCFSATSFVQNDGIHSPSLLKIAKFFCKTLPVTLRVMYQTSAAIQFTNNARPRIPLSITTTRLLSGRHFAFCLWSRTTFEDSVLQPIAGNAWRHRINVFWKKLITKTIKWDLLSTCLVGSQHYQHLAGNVATAHDWALWTNAPSSFEQILQLRQLSCSGWIDGPMKNRCSSIL